MSDIRDCFVSRYENGTLMEVDYSQLEVVALAILSNDHVLKNDIRLGLDMHRVRAAELFDCHEDDVTKAQRKTTKRLSFQLQYGAGAKSMAKSNGISIKLAQKFIDNYYERYVEVARWQKKIAATFQYHRRPSSRTTKSGLPAGMGFIQSPTSRRYVLFEEDNPYNMDVKFSPTKMKNYPVQGFATGDLVPIMLGKLFVALQDTSHVSDAEVKLVNTVHDSVLLDIDSDDDVDLLWIGRYVSAVLETAPRVISTLCNGDAIFDLDTPVNVEVGRNWGDMHELKL